MLLTESCVREGPGFGMTMPQKIDLPGSTAVAVEVENTNDLPCAVELLGLRPPLPTVVVVGGAGGLTEIELERLRPLFVEGIAPELQRHRAAVVDGGTLSGVMRLCGETRASLGASYPLVGVVAEGTVQLPDRPSPPDGAPLEPRHSHFVVVPGDAWGAESPWIARTASVLAGPSPTVTILINGGKIAYDDVEFSVRAGRRVIALAGSGRTADALTNALAGARSEERASALTASGLIKAVSADEPASLSSLLCEVLSEHWDREDS
ncbi:hypothetical protein EV589_2621 [Mycobacterium sp. BK558]|nr:hypothetical protein EV589_2621 [Mycobacterium sp. BK558]